jgi:hypothetical protein
MTDICFKIYLKIKFKGVFKKQKSERLLRFDKGLIFIFKASKFISKYLHLPMNNMR